jgi:hypothetical protein
MSGVLNMLRVYISSKCSAALFSFSLSETLQGLSVETLKAAHQRVLEGHMRGKVVMVY